MSSMTKPGFYRGRRISEYIEQVKSLKHNKELDKAEELLLNLVDATEKESKATRMGVAPWYYDELAKIYHERFSRQRHAPGSSPSKLVARLEKARQAIGTRTDLLETSSRVEEEILKEFAAWDEKRTTSGEKR